MNSGDLERFESFRRERNRRRLEGGPTRHLGKQASVLRELEEAENREIRNQQLTREVQEFFEEATRTAASIVSQVAETAEEQLQRTVADEMSEFLTATIRRAQEFVQLVRTSGGEVSNTELTANLHNIVGPKLDEFRFEGDAATAEHHVGRDPFAIRTDGPPADVYDDENDVDDRGPQGAVDRSAPPVEEHLAAEFLAEQQPEDGATSDYPTLAAWADRVAGDDDLVRTALKALVQVGAMERDEARAVYAELRDARVK